MAFCNYLDVYLYIIVFKTCCIFESIHHISFIRAFIRPHILSFILSVFHQFTLPLCQSFKLSFFFQFVSSVFTISLLFFFGLSALLPACLAGCLSACLPAFHSSRLPFILCFFPQICLPMYADVRGLYAAHTEHCLAFTDLQPVFVNCGKS